MSTIYTDVLIVGGGAAGVVAAISAAEAGAKNIVVLEKGSGFGGQGTAAQGMYAIDSRLQKTEGVEISVQGEYEDIMHATSYLSDGVLLRKYLENCGKTIDWMLDHGIDFVLSPLIQQFGHYPSGRVYHRWNHLPQRYARLAALARDLGVKLRKNTTVHELLKDGDRVVGALATGRDGAALEVRARAVVIATGGYAGSDEMLRDMLYDQIGETPRHFRSRSVGEGINMAWRAGAGKASERAVVAHGVIPSCDSSSGPRLQTTIALINLPVLWVNDRGQRFCNESVIYDSQFFGNSCIAQGGTIYAVYDRPTIEEFKIDVPYEMQFWDRQGKDGGFYPAPLERFEEEFQQLVAQGTGLVGETPEELAQKAGWDAEAFLETLAQYNRCVDAGQDRCYFKPAKYLRYPVKEGPFYALCGKTNIMVTVGGVKVDDRFRALTPQRKVIPGLYVIGADAGGIYHGYSYLSKEGFALGWALTSGVLVGGIVSEALASGRTAKEG